MQFAVYISDTPVTLKQSQGHQAWNENVDLKQGYNHAKFERSCFNSVRKKRQHFKVFFKGDNMSIISLQHVWNSKIMVYSWSTWRKQQLYKVSI